MVGQARGAAPGGPFAARNRTDQSGCASTSGRRAPPFTRPGADIVISVTIHAPPKTAIAGLKKHGLRADKSAAEKGGLLVLLDDLADVEAFARFATDQPDGLNVTYDSVSA